MIAEVLELVALYLSRLAHIERFKGSFECFPLELYLFGQLHHELRSLLLLGRLSQGLLAVLHLS